MKKKVGSQYFKGKGCHFCVWAPFAKTVEVIFPSSEKNHLLSATKWGYWEATLPNITPGQLYKYKLDAQQTLPDPASLSQPEGVHSWSQVFNQEEYVWNDEQWKGRALSEMIIYELHIGTFTPEGTFDSVISKLDHLEELGINTIEIMPLAQVPGDRNWGYDGVYPFAVQHSFGGANSLKKLIDTCHARGFSVLLDVVYNHLGPEGNYLSQYGPYFTQKYHTPWGSAINFDDEYCDAVRHHFLQNAQMWLKDFHFDGLRLDAVHEIIDRGALHFLKEMSQQTDSLSQKTGKEYVLIAESDLNDTRLIEDYDKGGYGLEGQWVDDFHHALHTVLTNENAGYYSDFGSMTFLAKTFKQAFIYDGIYSEFRKRKVGNSPENIEKSKFVVCIQNHDQVGNRLLGERLAQLVSFEKQKLAAAFLFTAPFVPMLFMGEEFGEKQPFQYFVSHGDEDLITAVREGRKREFEYFFHSDGQYSDPQAVETFSESKLNWDFNQNLQQKQLFDFYKMLIRLKKNGIFEPFKNPSLRTEASEESKILKVSSETENSLLLAIFNFGNNMFSEKVAEKGVFKLLFSSAEQQWGGNSTSEEIFNNNKIKLPAEAMLLLESKK